MTEQQGGTPETPQPTAVPGPGLQLPWVSAEPVAPSAPDAAERLRTALRRARQRARALGGVRLPARFPTRLPSRLRLPGRPRFGGGPRRPWDARRITMVAAMGCGAVLLLLAPFLKPDATPGDPAAAAAPDGRSPQGSHGRHHPAGTESPTDEPSPATSAPSASPSAGATTTEPAAASPSAEPAATTLAAPRPTTATATATTQAAPAPAAPAAPPAAPAQPAPAPPAPQPAFQAVAGFGCTGPGGRFQEVGAFRQGTDGWVTVGSGGDTGDSCDGRYEAVPMSGDKNKDDNSTYALWTFDVGAGSASCGISVYVPSSGSIQQVGGAPAYYTVAGASGADLGSFTVDQVGHLGSWVDAGAFRPAGGPLVVRLHNRGQDWTGSGQPTHAHIAAAPIRVTCRP